MKGSKSCALSVVKSVIGGSFALSLSVVPSHQKWGRRNVILHRFLNHATSMNQPLHLNISSWKANGGSSSFNPKFQFISAANVGNTVGRSDQCESGKVCQAGTLEGVGISSFHCEELQNRDSRFGRHRQEIRGGEEASLGGDSSDFAIVNVEYNEPAGNSDSARMEFEGGSDSPTSN
nr:hypothetical protein CFP56_00126 [Quercus suber]